MQTFRKDQKPQMRKHQVTFYSPGTFVSESSTYDIESWDTAKAVELAERVTERYNAKPYGFVFETIITAQDVPDGEGGTLKVQSKLAEKSGIHFLGGWLETYDDVLARNNKNESILRDNMRYNDHWIVCINTNSWRSTIPFEENSRIVDATGKIIESGDSPKHVAYRATKTAEEKAKNK
jgi:hypothetical protein